VKGSRREPVEWVRLGEGMLVAGSASSGGAPSATNEAACSARPASWRTGRSEGARCGAGELGPARLGGGALNRRGTLGISVARTQRAAVVP
jgi:hypothetical protein